jgi:hypothetical protein
MIYIIGVGHSVQAKPKGKPDTPEQSKYREVLSEAIQQFKPAVVGEEYNEDSLEGRHVDTGFEHESLTKQVAKSLHRFCDPDTATRISIGYKDWVPLKNMFFASGYVDETETMAYAAMMLNYWPLREQYWFERLNHAKDNNAVFVCGEAHVDSFRALLSKKNTESTELSRCIGLESDADCARWKAAKSYIATHPEFPGVVSMMFSKVS